MGLGAKLYWQLCKLLTRTEPNRTNKLPGLHSVRLSELKRYEVFSFPRVYSIAMSLFLSLHCFPVIKRKRENLKKKLKPGTANCHLPESAADIPIKRQPQHSFHQQWVENSTNHPAGGSDFRRISRLQRATSLAASGKLPAISSAPGAFCGNVGTPVPGPFGCSERLMRRPRILNYFPNTSLETQCGAVGGPPSVFPPQTTEQW